jgi:PAS domain S-box-containing protein
MTEESTSPRPFSDEMALLRSRLAETEETLQAIRQHMVDAFVVHRANGLEVVTLAEGEIPYRLIVEAMNEGIVTLISDGTILYCNRCFGEMVMAREEEIVGLQFRDFILPEEQTEFNLILDEAGRTPDRGEFCLLATDGTCVPVQLSVYPLTQDGSNGFAIIATDITRRVQVEEKLRELATKLTVVEQEERHRISQILHDDLQQRLFAIRAHIATLDINANQATGMSQDIEQVQDWLTDAITITRSLSINISPIILQGEGLAESLSWLAVQMKDQYGLKVHVHASEDFTGLDDQTRVELFQAVREALFNVVKHAGTLEATVQLAPSNGSGRIVVSDAGKGFSPAEIMENPQAAHGLVRVRERLGLIGCRLEIDSAPGQGTRMIIQVASKHS